LTDRQTQHKAMNAEGTTRKSLCHREEVTSLFLGME
jgi:hypothetical protein